MKKKENSKVAQVDAMEEVKNKIKHLEKEVKKNPGAQGELDGLKALLG